jgi:hypothetical protein
MDARLWKFKRSPEEELRWIGVTQSLLQQLGQAVQHLCRQGWPMPQVYVVTSASLLHYQS